MFDVLIIKISAESILNFFHDFNVSSPYQTEPQQII